MRIAVVVQRYGPDINGGAELHARYIAEHLARHAEVEVFTTCARDYISWRNDLQPGTQRVNGLDVHRFPVAHERSVQAFGRHSERVFHHLHSMADEAAWLEAEGPASPALVDGVVARAEAFDFVVLFSFRYYHACWLARRLAHKAVLVPTAERDPAIGLGIFRPVFNRVRALMYNSFEERDLIQGVSGNHGVPGVVVGVGSEIPERPDPERFRQKYGVKGRFAIYVGRIDENKGCRELFSHFTRYARSPASSLSLVLVGTPVMPIPDHPRMLHLGFLSDQDKFDAIAASELLVMPSPFESLSMVALEAWALGRPVLASAACDVLKGQSVRSNAGLYYENEAEFVDAMHWLGTIPTLAATLGANGRAYYQRHYGWPVIERKYLEMFERLQRESPAEVAARTTVDPLPGWLARRRRDLRASADVLLDVPKGQSSAGRGEG